MKKKTTRRAAFVYLLRCADGTIYTGWTYDIARRVRAHQAGRGARYTRSRRPVEMIYRERCVSRRAAMRREIEIKKMPRARKLRMTRGEGQGARGELSRAPRPTPLAPGEL